jgi:hypothetical protein
VFYLIYVSNATRRFDEAQLKEILMASRAANAEIEVTGLLLYKDGSFMQMLEGPENAVRALLDKILRDPRHYNLVTIQEGMNEARIFPGWSMGFRRLDDSAKDVTGYGDFENVMLTAPEFGSDPQRCLQLLRLFRDHV